MFEMTMKKGKTSDKFGHFWGLYLWSDLWGGNVPKHKIGIYEPRI
jgi:hypothetical protein